MASTPDTVTVLRLYIVKELWRGRTEGPRRAPMAMHRTGSVRSKE